MLGLNRDVVEVNSVSSGMERAFRAGEGTLAIAYRRVRHRHPAYRKYGN